MKAETNRKDPVTFVDTIKLPTACSIGSQTASIGNALKSKFCITARQTYHQNLNLKKAH